jgi:PTS system nitrogen regulatory IIA component
MKLVDLFPGERVFLDVNVANHKELIGFFSERASALGLVQKQLCVRALKAREDLGSTGLGHGIAIPHARIPDLDHSVGILARLAKPIDFEAVDQEPVDLALMLLMPEQSGGDQLKVLAGIARIARQERVMNAVRQADTVAEVLEIFHQADEDI